MSSGVKSYPHEQRGNDRGSRWRPPGTNRSARSSYPLIRQGSRRSVQRWPH